MDDDWAWYILTVSPLCEKAVKRRIEGDPKLGIAPRIEGAHVYVPTVRTRARRRHRKNVLVERVLFPRYVFIGFDREPPWLFVRKILGVQGTFAVDGVPYRVPIERVGEVMSRCDSGYYDDGDPPKVQRGMSVVVDDARWRDHVGLVQTIDKARGTADVLFEMLGRDVPARLRLDDLVSVSYSSQRMIG